MSSEHRVFANHLTFSQRHPDEPLPEPMKLKYLSDDLRRELCNEVHRFIKVFLMESYGSGFSPKGRIMIVRLLGKFLTIPNYNVNTNVNYVFKTVLSVITREPPHRVLSFLEILMDMAPNRYKGALAFTIQELFRKHASAYQLIICRGVPLWFHPCVSEEQAMAVTDVIETLDHGGLEGAKEHLRAAAGHINGGRHREAISDSIHAVESVARVIDPKANKTLGPALISLEKNGKLTNKELRKALENLYRYTNTEQGIRHALLEKDEASVGVDESLFMFGACASFVGYLARKHMAHECGERPIADEENLGKP